MPCRIIRSRKRNRFRTTFAMHICVAASWQSVDLVDGLPNRRDAITQTATKRRCFASREELGSELGEVEKRQDGVLQRLLRRMRPKTLACQLADAL